MAGIAQGRSLNMGVNSAMFTYLRREVVLIYFTSIARIDAFQTYIQLSNWLELSEN